MSPPLNLVSDYGDQDLTAIRAQLAGHCTPVDGFAAVVTALEAAVAQRTRHETLNLIGHSDAAHCLILGDARGGGWTLDDGAPTVFRLRLAGSLAGIGVQDIQILGCSTATTTAAWNVLHGIASSLGAQGQRVAVAGTRRVIDHRDYSTTEFTSAHVLAATTQYVLASVPDEINLHADEAAHGELDFRRILLEAPDAAAGVPPMPLDEDGLRRAVDCSRGWSLPGLHAAVQAERQVRASADGQLRRIQVLLDHELIRVFPTNEDRFGVVYRVNDPSALAALMSSTQRNPSSKL